MPLDIDYLDLEQLSGIRYRADILMSRLFGSSVLTRSVLAAHYPAVDGNPETLDELDSKLEVWAREVPNLEPVTEGIVERIQILAKAFDRSLDETLAETGLDRRSFHVLAKLRKVGPPYRRSAGDLASQMRLSSGAMTNRIDRMEQAGLIRRLPDPNDRRGTLVEPTPEGHAIWDRSVGTQASREAKMASVLDEADRVELHRLLRALMRAFPGDGHRHDATGDSTGPHAAKAPVHRGPSG
jgi:DNA-binding MarR family transcriptional regulator